MDKKTALVTLVEHSFFLDEETKLAILDALPSMSKEQVDKIGSFLSIEHDFIVKNESSIRAGIADIMENLKNWQPAEQVLDGAGKP